MFGRNSVHQGSTFAHVQLSNSDPIRAIGPIRENRKCPTKCRLLRSVRQFFVSDGPNHDLSTNQLLVQWKFLGWVTDPLAPGQVMDFTNAYWQFSVKSTQKDWREVSFKCSCFRVRLAGFIHSFTSMLGVWIAQDISGWPIPFSC